MEKIGTVNNKPVMYEDGRVFIYGTNIQMYGVQSKQEAFNLCEKNFCGFKKC